MINREEGAVLKCEWNLCSQIPPKMSTFLLHVAEHVASINAIPSCDGYLCLWRGCTFTTHSKDEVDRHIYFHAFHAKIKGVGEIILKELNLQCMMDDESLNLIPEIPEPFECMWKCDDQECGFTFVSAQDFYWHVKGHVISVEQQNKFYPCGWQDCSFKGKTFTYLTQHCRSHTQEKVVACSRCGSIFSSPNKFQDHCHRQLPAQCQPFECSYCTCKFATERLLKEHVRRHVNHLKCPQCDMTCTTRSTLLTHVMYRHSDSKPLKCPHCPKRFKLQQDVSKHLVAHSAQPSFTCAFPRCHFSSRAYTTYIKHIKVTHEGLPSLQYVCHMCDTKFSLGTQLTIHLKKKHNYHWPAGHARFRYSRHDDGLYRLQTTRFETIELARQIQGSSSEMNQGMQVSSVGLTREKHEPGSKLHSLTDDKGDLNEMEDLDDPKSISQGSYL